MNGIKDFKSYEKDIDFFFVNLSQTKYKREEMLRAYSIFTKFMDTFHCTIDEMCEIFDKYGIRDRDLFEYTILKNDYLVSEDGIYTEKWVRNGYNGRFVKQFYNVYLTVNPYASLVLNTVSKELVIRRFPFLMKEPFITKEKRFTNNIHSLPKTLNAKISSIDHNILFDNELTIDDLIKIYGDKSYMDSYVETPTWNVYHEGQIYITVDKERAGYSINTSFNELENGDWNAIENRKVFSICLYDKNGERIKGKWYDGKQKNAPYFDNPIVETLKKMITK